MWDNDKKSPAFRQVNQPASRRTIKLNFHFFQKCREDVFSPFG